MTLYLLNVFIHVLAAVIWLGGMFFFALVGAPVLRNVSSPELRASLFSQLGRQFRTVGWVAISVLLVTGVLNLYFRDLLSSATLGSSEFWRSRYGRTLGMKLGAVGVMLVVQAIHDFHFGPAASRAVAGSDEALRLRRTAAMLARFSAVIALVLLYAAVRLARGG